MSARFQRLEALFNAALDVTPAQRAAWCAEQCRGDAALEHELLALLAGDERLVGTPTANPLRVAESALDAVLDREDLASGRLGPYHLREEIGRGGMGRVLRAVRFEDGVEREVAIKFVRRELLDETTRRRFKQELRALAALDHPGIARLLEGGETDDGTPYVVMELVRGETLSAYCEKRRLGVRARVELFRQVLAAVAHAHRNLIVHRDLKPGNVLVDGHGVKLLDFGLAKSLHVMTDAAATATIDRYFTPAYAAPEQLRGTATGVGVDVYALGAMLYELLAGAPPFKLEGRTAAEVERLVLATPPAALDRATAEPAWRRTLRGDLDAIVQKALRKEQQQRYLSAEQFDEDIARWLDGRPVAAVRWSTGYRARKFLARHRIAAAVATVVVTAVGIGIGAVLHGANVAAAERDRAQAALAIVRDAFKAADPLKAAGPQLGAREILAAAADRLRGLDATQPQLFCELAAEIADVQITLGIYERDRSLTERALELATATDISADLLQRLRALDAVRRLALHDVDGADAVMRQAEAERNDDPEMLNARAYYWLLKNDTSKAIPLAQRAARIAADRRQPDLHAAATLQLADLFNTAGRREDALATFDVLVGGQTAELGATHPRTLSTRLRRVLVLSALERHDAATAEAAAVVAALPERFGADSAVVARASSVLGHARLAAGDADGAVPAFEAATEGYTRSLGPYHANTLRARFNLAHVLFRAKADPARTDATFERVIEDAMPRGGHDRLMWYFRAQYAKTLLDRGERDKAAAVLLPPGLEPDLSLFDETNRAEYLGFLRDALPTACGSPVANADATSRRASRLLCPDA